MKKKKPLFFRFLKALVRIFYRKRTIEGIDNLPKESSLIIGNHAQLHGPIASQLYFPGHKYIWCIGQMMNIKEVPAYAYEDFWSKKPKGTRWFYKILSYIIAPLSAYVFNNADTIGVYKDTRLLSTFRNTIEKLNDGANVIIFPEYNEKFNEIVNEFQDKFVDVAVMYYKKYKKELSFVPMYNAVKLKKIIFGKPIKYDPNIPISEQRKIICDYLKKEITLLAKQQVAHTVVPYDNIKKKDYPRSK